MSDLEARKLYLPDALDLVVELIPFKSACGMDVRKNAIALPFADIERLAIPRVDQSVDVPPQLAAHVGRKGLDLPMAAHALLQLMFVMRKTGCSSATFGAFPH